jgi:GntR family transcriptional regulator
MPGRDRLAEELGVAKDTVAQALNYLAGEGVIELKPKSGAWPLPERRPARWPIDVATIRRHPRGYLLGAGTGDWEPIGNPEVVRVPCPADVAPLLADDVDPVDQGAEVVGRRRVVGPGYAVQLTITYLAPRLVEVLPVVAAVDTGPGGWIERVEQHFDAPVHAEWFALSRAPTRDEAQLFALPTGASVLQVRRVIANTTGKPFAVEVVVWDARRVELVGVMRRDTSAEWPVHPATMRNSPGE